MTENTRPLDGIHALVTGSGSGIGAAIADDLGRMGAAPTLVGRCDIPLAEKGRAIHGVFCHAQAMGLTDNGALQGLFANVASDFDTLVNNVGAAETASVLKTDMLKLNRTFDVNFRTAFSCAQAVSPRMLQSGIGRIINIASAASIKGYPCISAYCAAKHALLRFTRSLAAELTSTNITVNAVCPGYTDTGLIDRAVGVVTAKTGTSADAIRAKYASLNPGGRLIEAWEVASAVGWLCFSATSAITGQAVIVADGDL